jgi:hypothetical protein
MGVVSLDPTGFTRVALDPKKKKGTVIPFSPAFMQILFLVGTSVINKV